jgi:hypothetical protein
MSAVRALNFLFKACSGVCAIAIVLFVCTFEAGNLNPDTGHPIKHQSRSRTRYLSEEADRIHNWSILAIIANGGFAFGANCLRRRMSKRG